MVVLEHDRKRPPEELGLVHVVPRLRRLRDHYRVVAPAHALRACVGEERRVGVRAGREAHVVAYDELRAREVLEVQVDVALHVLVHLLLRDAARAVRVALAPEPVRADVHERDLAPSVVPGAERLEEVLELLEEHGVHEVWVDRVAVGVRPAALAPPELVAHPLRARVEHPLGRRVLHPVLRRRDAERDLRAALDPTLRRSVDGVPVELALLRLEVRPGKPQVHNGASGEPLERVALLYAGAIGGGLVRIVVHGPSHAGVAERPPVVRGADCGRERGGCGDDSGKRQRDCFHAPIIPRIAPLPQ